MEVRLGFPFFFPKPCFWEAESSSLQQRDTFSFSDSSIHSAALSRACLMCRRNTPHPSQYGDEQDLVLCLAAFWQSHMLGDTASGREHLGADTTRTLSRTSALARCKVGSSEWGQESGGLRKASIAMSNLQKSSLPTALLFPAQATQ